MPFSHTAYRQIVELQEMYLASLSDKHSEITTSWILAEQQNWQKEATEALRTILSRLANSAASYGLTDISATANKTEHYLRQVPLAQDNLADLHHALQSLCSLLMIYARDEANFQPIVPDTWGQMVAINNQILLLDHENPTTTELIQQLEDNGYMVQAFSNVVDLATAIDTLHPSVILFDILSTTDYVTEFEQLAQLLSRYQAKVPTIFFSAYDDFAIRLHAIRAGAQAYLAKPITTPKLLNYLDSLLTFDNHPSYRVLLITDDVDIANLHQVIFKQTRIEALFIHSQEEILVALVEFKPEVILIDLCLPLCQGISLATLLRQEPAYLSIPIIFLATDEKEIRQVNELRIGGEDYLVKPVAVDYLVQLIKTRARYFRQLNQFIGHDGLTGFLNYTAFSQRLTATIANAERLGSSIAVAIIDIDNFKGVNQQYGYWTGNRILRQVAKAVRQRLRRGDLLGRYMTDKFIIALPGADLASAQQVLKDLVEELSKTPYTVNGIEFYVTFGVGITYYPGHSPLLRDSYDIVEIATQALRSAKRKGCQQVATISMTDLFF